MKEMQLADEDGEPVWPRMRFELMWLEHGGSGLGMSFSEAQDLDLAVAIELLEMIQERKKREAEAIRNARAGK